MTLFIEVSKLAEAAGVSRQAIEKSVAKIIRGEATTWRGSQLIIRQIHGRGGNRGLQYQVRVDSLPLNLQEQIKASSTALYDDLKHGDAARSERDWWVALLAPVIAHPRYSRDRGAAIRNILNRRHLRPGGKWVQLSERTVQLKLAAYEANGVAGLSRRKRSDAGQRKTILFTTWDRAVPFDDALKERIAHVIRQYIRGLHKAGESASVLALLSGERLKMLTAQAGYDPGSETLDRICRIPSSVIGVERVFRKVHTFLSDRKTYEDRRPRIARQRIGLAPMDVVVADIHPVDILCRRDDGSIATPRAIAWLDLATNRVWFDLILLNKGEGVRNAHVIGSFANVVRGWGAPRALYLDNGSEYNWSVFIDDALKLIDQEGRRSIGRIAPWAERDSNIVRARPYNAAAKPIEGIFGLLEKHHLASIPGWIGGDRMRKKSANVGREPDPFPGTFAELRALILAALQMYEVMPQKGTLNGLSPRRAYEQAIAAGWGMTAVNPDALRIAFSTPEQRVVRQGRVQQGGQTWTCRELQAYQGDRVTVLVPKYEDWSRLPVQDEAGHLLGFAEPDRAFAMLDPAGAAESAARASVHRAGLRALDRAAPDVDRLRERIAYIGTLPAPIQAPVAARISHSEQAAEIVARMNEPEAARLNREQRRVESHNAEMLRIGSKFNPNRRKSS